MLEKGVYTFAVKPLVVIQGVSVLYDLLSQPEKNSLVWGVNIQGAGNLGLCVNVKETFSPFERIQESLSMVFGTPKDSLVRVVREYATLGKFIQQGLCSVSRGTNTLFLETGVCDLFNDSYLMFNFIKFIKYLIQDCGVCVIWYTSHSVPLDQLPDLPYAVLQSKWIRGKLSVQRIHF